ncbi:class I SAM-dependent methyltransferase [Selenomonadales bacterium OttesenSCG-928-I06]|nr:class I SAM-dependent methyltransferase [Selenomonadales bacterium OttesenSCG-928-I06]
MIKTIIKHNKKPKIYADSTSAFWNDPHISKGMLEAHLNPNLDSATRNHDFIDKSVEWISNIAPANKYNNLLDLGCGPGLYAERFHSKEYNVTGLDLSKRSIDYAINQALMKNLDINYICDNYLTINHCEKFDLITLIYCDFGVLSDENRSILLEKIFTALKPGGKFVFDVFTPKKYENKLEFKSWSSEKTGFWSDQPYICLNSFYRYEKNNTFLEQYIIATENTVNCYNIWEHTFTLEEIKTDLKKAGFKTIDFFGDISGKVYSVNEDTICLVAEK